MRLPFGYPAPRCFIGLLLSAWAAAISLSLQAAAAQHPPGAEPKTGDAVAPSSVSQGAYLTTNQGQRINDDQNTLKAGPRGPSLLEDFHFREKITHFDHERIPERVVHARGSGAHGYFQLTQSLEPYTKAKVLTDTNAKTPVFVRFSTVNGSRGSADTVRDARGFAVKFYTSDGVWDLVGNNIPVFFIQDAIKFPDLVHAFKPEPDDEIPQASTAHNNFWDFIANTPESMHMIMWIMSDRAIPRSYRMMEGFGVHTFRLANAQGKSTFVKFHWKPLLGVHSLVWDESQELTGRDPDFHRRDLWEAIADGAFPEYELGVQLLAEDDVKKVPFDVLDATKIWPEDVVPVQKVGKLILNKNPDNFFAETEQSAFHTAHVVSGIDFSDDPLLQGRNFSYLDTQINRFGTPNFPQLPINQPRSPVNNHQQDGFMRYSNRSGKANYEPNTLPGVNAKEASEEQGGYVTYPEPVESTKIRERSKSFGDHYTQAALFYNSMSQPEKEHIADALRFELGKVTLPPVKQRMVEHLAKIDGDLAKTVGAYLGIAAPAGDSGARAGKAIALSQMETPKGNIKTRKIAILAADGVNAADVAQMQKALSAAGAKAEVVAPHLGELQGGIKVDKTFETADSVMYDAVYVPGGRDSFVALHGLSKTHEFVLEAYNHKKPIAASGEGIDLLKSQGIDGTAPGIVAVASAGDVAKPFAAAIGEHRFWQRAAK